MTVRAYLALGSNVGEREKALLTAIQALDASEGIAVRKLSSIYETDPVGYTDQPAFLNMVVAVDTELGPHELLARILQIEKELGRVRTIRWGPRMIDIDILLYGEEQITDSSLQIPHPSMIERAFVLVPLQDVWDGKELPVFRKRIEDYLAAAEDVKGVQQWGTLAWATASGPSES